MEDIHFYSGVAGIVGLELISELGREELARPLHKGPPPVLKRSTSDWSPLYSPSTVEPWAKHERDYHVFLCGPLLSPFLAFTA